MNSSKRSFIIIVVAFIAPIILGSLVYMNKERLGMGSKTVNYGTLIHPARPTEILDLLQGDKPADAKTVLQGKWTLLQIAPTKCDTLCQEHLLLIKRVRTLMNEHMRRIRTVLVTNNGEADSTAMQKSYPDLILTHTNTEKSKFIAQFKQTNIETGSTTLYLIDPLGNLMMLYPQAEPNVKRILKDLKRLLKYSRLG
jgi:cytochrome oxidase Cu insertion factor (SCO1/SenC/PrrC family)